MATPEAATDTEEPAGPAGISSPAGPPEATPTLPDEVAEQISLAREVSPDTLPWVLTLARKKAKANLDAHRCNYEKGESRPETWERNRRKWSGIMADLDAMATLARVSLHPS